MTPRPQVGPEMPAPVDVDVSPAPGRPIDAHEGHCKAEDRHDPTPVLIGAGRSGVVYKRLDDQGRIIADKIFGSEGLTKLVQYVLLGAPNPYAWNQDAVICAVLRRRIVTVLLRSWFDEELVVAQGYDHGWNETHRAWSLRAAFVDGAPPTLHHPMNRRGASEVKDLVRRIMKPLQAHLIDAGFDGLAWQAGLGNPVALANFLRVRAGATMRWAWIDLESGVPALFPANPLELLRFYLPRSVKHRRPLFDDVDVSRLRVYVSDKRSELSDLVGPDGYDVLIHDIEALAHHQKAWHALRRHECSIGARFARGAITQQQAQWYSSRPARWYLREGRRLPRVVGQTISSHIGRATRWLRSVSWGSLPRQVGRFLFSQLYRYDVAHRLVSLRINAWEGRGQLTRAEADRLRGNLANEESAAYMTDFGVHLAIKPFVKFVEFIVFPALFAAEVIGPVTLAIVMMTGGSVARTLYTLGRVVQCSLIGHERPWVALGVGAMPVFGNLAYPVQIVYSSTIKDDLLAQFLLYDGCSMVGRRLPIWGGPDTHTEHVFNHLPDALVRSRG